MTRVTRNDTTINVMGHAGDKIVCAMITSQTVGLIKNITERLHEDPDFVLKPGIFTIDTKDLTTDAMALVDAFLYCMQGLAGSYPHNIMYLA